MEKLDLPMRPYAVLATCEDGGMLETITDALAIDTLKKKLMDNTKMSKDLKNVKGMLDKQSEPKEFGFYDDIEDEVDIDFAKDFAWIEDEVEGIDDILKDNDAAN